MLVGGGQILSRRATLRLLGSGVSVALLAACSNQVGAPQPTRAAQATSGSVSTTAATSVSAAPTTPAGPTAGATPGGTAQAAATVGATTQPGPTAAAATSPGAAVRGGTLRAGLIGDVGAINPHAIGPQPLQTIFSIWDRLIAYDTSGKAQPMLAESWESSSDQTQLKFNLRHGVQFHSGRELTSEDVKWNLLRVRNPAVNATQFNKQSQWFTDHRHVRQIHRGADPRSPAPKHSRFLRALQYRRPRHARQAERCTAVDRHGSLQTRRVQTRRTPLLQPQRELLEEWLAVARPVQRQHHARRLGRDGPAGGGRARHGLRSTRPGRHALHHRFPLRGVRQRAQRHHRDHEHEHHRAADQQQALPPGDPLRDRSRALRADGTAKRGEARSLPWTAASPAYDAARIEHFTLRPRQSEIADGRSPGVAVGAHRLCLSDHGAARRLPAHWRRSSRATWPRSASRSTCATSSSPRWPTR